MRCRTVLLATILSTTAVTAAPKPSSFYPAEDHFNAIYTLRERVIAQTLLIGAGFQNAVPTERFSIHTFNATRDFQIANGLVPSGAMDKATSDRLFAVVRPMFNLWDFHEIGHPSRGRAIWMPQGMGLRSYSNRNGLTYRDDLGRFRVSYNFLAGLSAASVYGDTLDKMRREGTVVHYSVIKDGWFAISATTVSGEDEYMRYHQDGDGILGFVAFWNNANGVVNGERVAVLMSASLGSVMNGRPFVEPPDFPVEAPARIAEAPSVLPLTRPDPAVIPALPKVTAPGPSPTPPPAAEATPEDKLTTGSGFFVDGQGRFVTNNHVIAACKAIIVRTPDGSVRKAVVKATDAANDMALIQVSGAEGHRFAPLRLGARLGEGIATFGYPHLDMLANTGNFTLGNVTALAGVNDDSRFYQISAPVQSGNSGGPVLDNFGNVVGVVRAKLNALKIALASGDFPQNINFAIKGAILASFLESNGITVTPGGTAGAKLEPADLADMAKTVSGLVACE